MSDFYGYDGAVGFFIIFGSMGLIAGSLQGLLTRDEPAMVILKAIGGCIAGFLLTILLILTLFRHMDM